MAALVVAAPATAEAQCVRTDSPPRKIVHVDPIYPPVALAARVQGIVILEIDVNASGAVTSTRVLRSIPLLDAAAVTAVAQWRFEPPGSPCVTFTVTVEFTIPTDGDSPSNLQASVAGNLLTLSWQAPSTAPGAYLIEAGTASGLSNIANVQVGATPPGLSAVVPNGTYFIRVKAVYQGVLSAPSNEVVVTVGGGGCTPPSSPTLAATASGTTVTLSWSPPSSGTPPITYTLIAGSSPGTSNLANTPLGALTSFQANAPAGTYYVRIVASNACGTSNPSNEVTVVVGGPTGTPLLTFTVTPNPVPFTGVFAGCAGSPIPNKTWVYTLRIANQGSGPFTIGSFWARLNSPLLPIPVDSPPAGRDLFALAFGASTIPPQAALQGQLCVAGDYDDATLVWTFVDVSGTIFTAPVIQFLRGPF